MSLFDSGAYDPGRYGAAVGDYDVLYPGEPDTTAAAVALLASLATEHPDPSMLEFGIGTGRLALGVAGSGVRVAGVDGSESMLAALHGKEEGAALPVVLGDYRDAKVPGRFSVVVLALNGIFDPRGVDAQLDIFRNAAAHLVPGGVFVVESWVMSDQQRNGEWVVVPRFVADRHVELQLSRYDIDRNEIERTLMHLRPGGPEFVTVRDTYASPGELDVMAHVCGFRRRARYRNWNGSEFSATSAHQISVFELVAADVGTVS